MARACHIGDILVVLPVILCCFTVLTDHGYLYDMLLLVHPKYLFQFCWQLQWRVENHSVALNKEDRGLGVNAEQVNDW